MPFNYNNTAITSSFNPKFNGTALKSINYNGMQVWLKSQYLFNYGLISGYGWTASRNGNVNTNNISVWETGYDFASYVSSSSKINLNGWNTVKMYLTMNNNSYVGGHIGLGINNEQKTTNWVAVNTISSTNDNASKSHTLTVNVSSLTGSYYIIPYAYSANAGATIHCIWLE